MWLLDTTELELYQADLPEPDPFKKLFCPYAILSHTGIRKKSYLMMYQTRVL